MHLNAKAVGIAEQLVARASALGVDVVSIEGVRVVDCGVRAAGGIDAGLLMARAAMAGLGEVGLVPAGAGDAIPDGWPDCRWPMVVESSAAPVAACLAAQYAGWKVEGDGFFAMASGPVRAAIGRERIYDAIGLRERAEVAVGLLETARLPPPDVCRQIAADAGVRPEALTLLVAPTASLAGTLQVTARALETALHKLHDIGFDVGRVRAGRGRAPLPPAPPGGDDLLAIGRTNDAILYGSHVVLEVEGPDDDLAAVGSRAVSQASPAHGQPFLRLFEEAGRDFYRLDPALFAPARLDLVAIESGRVRQFGRLEPDLVARSFGS
jgi:methenyltetrahydromethanopterin cyclohydrolase